MDDCHKLQEERSPKDTVVPDVKTGHLKCQHLPVDDCPGMIPWKVSCTGVNSAKLRPISMKVFLIIKFSEPPLSIKVLVILCRPIGILTMKGRFLSDSSMSR
jgi:hypothetical protein